MLRLHDNRTSGNAYKVRLLLTQLGIPFERTEYDIDHGASRTPEFLRTKNANGRIPVLELDDGRCLPESNAILWYLGEAHRSSRPTAARAAAGCAPSCCSGCSSSSTATSPTSRRFATGSRTGWR